MDGRTDSPGCGRATAVASVPRTLAKCRLSNPSSKYPNAQKDQSEWIGLFVVGEDGFEPSKRYAADLQSVPFGHSGTPPYEVCSVESNSVWSRQTDSNPRPADYKSAALPTELCRRLKQNMLIIAMRCWFVKTYFSVFHIFFIVYKNVS